MTSAPDGNDTTLQPYRKLHGKAGYKRVDNQCGLFGAARTQLIQLFRKLRRGEWDGDYSSGRKLSIWGEVNRQRHTQH